MQRIHALRAGVNIMMYMLTGNYKSDQVHVPVLLERLGQ
ncbi:MAG: RNA-binding protein, partial [Rhizobiaceae bacterium]|nr:RNA-binding protein [Rhizobiaceae bacterium]